MLDFSCLPMKLCRIECSEIITNLMCWPTVTTWPSKSTNLQKLFTHKIQQLLSSKISTQWLTTSVIRNRTSKEKRLLKNTGRRKIKAQRRRVGSINCILRNSSNLWKIRSILIYSWVKKAKSRRNKGVSNLMASWIIEIASGRSGETRKSLLFRISVRDNLVKNSKSNLIHLTKSNLWRWTQELKFLIDSMILTLGTLKQGNCLPKDNPYSQTTRITLDSHLNIDTDT